MLPDLSPEQRHTMQELGFPPPLYDPGTNTGYLLMEANISPDPLGGFLASAPGYDGAGGGDSPEDALLALSFLLRASLAP
jgi:hypothetical protein